MQATAQLMGGRLAIKARGKSARGEALFGWRYWGVGVVVPRHCDIF